LQIRAYLNCSCRRRVAEQAVKFSDRIYAVGNFQKKRLRIRYMADPCSLANQSADHL